MAIASVNPVNGQTVREYDPLPPAEVAQAVEAAHRAFLDWRHTSFAEIGRAHV